MARTPTAYWDYIRVEELLSLQSGLEPDASKLANDEVMFITIHQIDELWMRLVLRELVAARDLFVKVPVPEQALASAVRGIDRMSQILGLIADHFALMETMTTRDYLAFRDKLNPASGFQSAQLRQIEILAGLPETMRIPLGQEKSYMAMLKNPDGSATSASRRVEAALADTPTLVDAISNWLYRTPIQGSMPGHPEDDARVRAFIDRYCAAHAGSARAALALAKEATRNPADADRLDERFQREIDGARDFLLATDVAEPDRARASRVRAALIFIESYRELPLLAWPRAVIDSLVAFEQAFVIFRQRHARMVERIIGRRTGTGGSAGVEYLDNTALRYRIFRDVWAVRTLLVQESVLPPLENPAAYGFAVEI
ncbi:MAG: tryptophan 2,3-dioxygenase [Kofleriaceae bacterium]|nr:tryptophan 2,3-dioxygenase [Kofleriaceae bacterium]